MTITGGSGLPKDEIDRMVKEAEAHEAEDKAQGRRRDPQPGRGLRLLHREARQRQQGQSSPTTSSREVTDKVNALKGKP